MPNNNAEVAQYLYSQLLIAIRSTPISNVFSQLNTILDLLLKEATAHTDVLLSGACAKMNYLLFDRNSPAELKILANRARKHLKGPNDTNLPDESAMHLLLIDHLALCRLVEMVYDIPIPLDNQSFFPQETTKLSKRHYDVEYLRIIADRADDTFIYGQDDEGNEVTVRYTGDSLNIYHFDWHDIKPLIDKGTQINIIHPTLNDGVLHPELMVVEPDLLIDITTIASCFEDYGHSERNALLKKITPAPNSEAILLGNLSGILLDHALYGKDGQTNSDRIYKECCNEFFASQALNILTCDISSEFHSNGREQMKNINDVLQNQLPNNVRSSNTRNIILEPSFFSEMLGIQGRMDYLQMDQKVLIEQKSGKCGWPQKKSDEAIATLQHKVQTLLYMTLLRYNYADRYRRNAQQNEALQAFLMYSKYAKGLVIVTSMPELLFEAIMLRNKIAKQEISLSHGGIKTLSQLSADDFNQIGVTGHLWTDYQKPQIEDLLRPLHTCSPLELSYYERMMTFVACEHLHSKIGNSRKACSGFASIWNESLDNKRQAGNIFDNLTLINPSIDKGIPVEQVVLRFSDTCNHDMANFRRGDIVMLYPYRRNTQPDARRTMVFRGTISDISDNDITIVLRARQGSAMPLLQHQADSWAIEHDFIEASYSGLYRGLHSMLSAPKERRELLMLQRRPKVSTDKTLVGDYGQFNDLMLKVRNADELFLIIGPPGTGKTSFGLLNTLREQMLSNPKGNVLLMAYTNRAVDEICSKLIEKKINFVRIGSEMMCSDESKPMLLDRLVQGCNNRNDLQRRIDQCQVVVGTTSSISSKSTLMKLKTFDLAIIDEASQLLEPHLMGLLCACPNRECAIKKIVMIGDHKQLPAVVQQSQRESVVTDAILNNIELRDCRESLFERLLRRYGNDTDVVYMLRKQGRMHETIAQLPSDAFYEGMLDIAGCPHQQEAEPIPTATHSKIDETLQFHRYAFFDVQNQHPTNCENVNIDEATLIATLAKEIYDKEHDTFDVNHTIGIIVPYRNQISAIRDNLKNCDKALQQISIDTVERYQGSQRDYIIYGTTVQQRYQLEFLTESSFVENGHTIDRKLNVALTRARRYQIVVGNAELLQRNLVYANLIDYYKQKGAFIDGNKIVGQV